MHIFPTKDYSVIFTFESLTTSLISDEYDMGKFACGLTIKMHTHMVECKSRFDRSRGYTTLNIHEIWLRLFWGEHLLYIRAKMTSFVNSHD